MMERPRSNDTQFREARDPSAKLYMVDEATILCQVANRPVIYALRIDTEAMRFELLYKTAVPYDLMTVAGDKVVLCGKATDFYLNVVR